MNEKPLNGPIFGKIGHLPGSRTGESDRTIDTSEVRLYTEKGKTKHDFITVHEKMDGSCVGVLRTSVDTLVPLQRHGYIVDSSPRPHIAQFREYVDKYARRFLGSIDIGEWIVGEWLLQPHGVKYNLDYSDMFMPFAIFSGDRYSESEELEYAEFEPRVLQNKFTMPGCVAKDGLPVKIEEVRRYIVRRDQPYSIDKPEGAVWRRDGIKNGKKFTTRTKWVRHDHVPGMYWEERQVA